MSKDLEKEGFETVLCMERTYGACDVRENEAKLLGCDAILHAGHEDYGVKTELPVVYWGYKIDVDPIPALKKNLAVLKDKKNIGLVTSTNFADTILAVKKFLEKNGKTVFVHKSLQMPGQMLGCRIGAGKNIENKIDCFVCISAGRFYGLGLALFTEKPIYNLDLEKSTLESIKDVKRRIEKVIAWNKGVFKEAKKVAFLVSWKRGQMFGDPFKVKEKLEKQGKEVYILAFDEISMDKIEGLKLDALVNFSCPRIGSDDLERTKIPILNWSYLE